ncbi:MAG TPA: hypothetical protein VHI31_00655 [Actinomycetota bacterium]|nr:hypothetical protein [Actinomycetota bacterium]
MADEVIDKGDEVVIPTDEEGDVDELPPVGEAQPVTTTTVTEGSAEVGGSSV